MQMYFTVQTWSLKYNLFFQYVLDIPVFPESVLMKELNFYMNQVMNVFGVPLDSRSYVMTISRNFLRIFYNFLSISFQ